MKNKIFGIFVCILLIAAAIPIVSSVDKNIENNENEEDTPDKIFIEEDCGCGNTNGISRRFGIMEERSKPFNTDVTLVKPTIINDLPEYFSWKDYLGEDWTTPSKDQNWPIPCGSCWLFAAIGALESVINIREGRADLDVDLSEQYVLSCLPRAGDCYYGSWPFKAFYYIMSNSSSGNNCNGIIPESYFPYRGIDAEGYDLFGRKYDPILCDEKSDDWEEYLIPISDFGLWYPDGSPEDRDAIKSQIMQIGPVAAYMMVTFYIHGVDNFDDWGYEHQEPDDYYTTTEQYPWINHNIILVGWKDDPSIGNGGYWICKNSDGGEMWGYDGFFNIEYGCLNIDKCQIDWVNYNPNVSVNWEPVADAGGNIEGSVGEEIVFDGTDSFDHEGEIISYEWNFGDGNSGFGNITSHTFNSMGIYPVTLTVSDNEGNMKNNSIWAFIESSNDPPGIPIINGPPNGEAGIEYEYRFSAVDPDGDDVYYYIYWGDWSAESWIGPFPSGEEISINHTYIDKATYIIRVKAKDRYNYESDWNSLELSMPKNKRKNFNLNLQSWLSEYFPWSFPILKYLLKLTLDWNNKLSFLWR